MLLEQILQEDVANCRQALQKDSELQALEEMFYELLEGAKEVKFELEDVFSGFTAKCIRIAYLQGMKDFAELYSVLKDSVNEILTMLEDEKARIL